jgi:hypothetical protein
VELLHTSVEARALVAAVPLMFSLHIQDLGTAKPNLVCVMVREQSCLPQARETQEYKRVHVYGGGVEVLPAIPTPLLLTPKQYARPQSVPTMSS